MSRAVNPLGLRTLGHSSLRVTQLGLGTGPLGGARTRVSEAQADATVAAAAHAGINYFDTAPWYGVGQAELHLGHGLRTIERHGVVLSTKVGRILVACEDAQHPPYIERWPGGAPNDLRFDYTREGVLRSYEDSLRRLGVDRIDALVIHDLDFKFHTTELEVNRRLSELDKAGGYAALAELKSSGAIQAIGVGINQIGMIPRFLGRFDVDFVLLAMPYTLMDQQALERELPMCSDYGVAVVIGAPFCSGLLAPGSGSDAWYGYCRAESDTMQKLRRMQEVCTRHQVSISAAALQFPVGHPAVVAVIPGPESAQQVQSNLSLMRESIPSAFWHELKALNLLHADAPTP